MSTSKTPKTTTTAKPIESAAANEPTFETIAVRAFLIWETEGRPEGRDAENWLQAEAQLRETLPQG